MTDQVRGGWLLRCANCLEELRATILKTWGARWHVLYSNKVDYLFLDYSEAEQSESGPAKLKAMITANGLELESANLHSEPICPCCGREIPMRAGNPADFAVWLEGQLLIDATTNLVTRLSRVEVRMP